MTHPRLSVKPLLQPREHVAAPSCIDGRYEVDTSLGRGGMALVYRVRDRLTGQMVALKWLDMSATAEQLRTRVDLFEREYYTLQQLTHPRIVRCLEYGVHDGTPFYTMELLDGGDLRDLAPLPWQNVCQIAYDVCAALSLLHSRQSVHLDLSPRNIRLTTDGKAKLIDFGLLAPMGVCAVPAGTPAFIAPEVMGDVTVDGRADLFSLGATLYFALTGRTPYAVQRLQDLPNAWRSSPVAPARFAQDVPSALSALVLSMIRIDVGSRPKSAGEVMETLSLLMESVPSDLSISYAYLITPQLVGRDDVIQRFRARMVQMSQKHGAGFVISGAAGSGRSRALDAFVLEAKLVGAVIVRASSSDSGGRPFAAAAALVRQLAQAMPEETSQPLHADGEAGLTLRDVQGPYDRSAWLTELTRPDLDRAATHDALHGLFLRCAKAKLLAIAVDDLQLIDDASASLLASLVSVSPPQSIMYAATLEEGARVQAESAVEILLAHAERITLSPLDEQQLSELLRSMFGDVTGLIQLSEHLFRLSGGRPRDCIAIAKLLVDDGVITHTNGVWTLPDSYAESQLPASYDDFLQRQMSHLSAAARQLAGMLGLALVQRLSRAQLLDSFGRGKRAVAARALDDLASAQLLTIGASTYALCHHAFARHIIANFSDDVLRALHDQLAAIYVAADADQVVIAYHQLSGSAPGQGLQRLLALGPDAQAWESTLTRAQGQVPVDAISKTLLLALRIAEAERAPRRVLLALRERLAHQTTLGDDPEYYYGVAAECLEQYKQDSGYNIWQSLDPSLPEKTRAERALTLAFERWNITPEAERVLNPIDALKALVRWVAISLPIASRLNDLSLSSSLDGLLTPFVCVSPLVDLISRNAHAARLMRCDSRIEEARALWSEVLTELDTRSDMDLVYRIRMRTSICCVLGVADAMLGTSSDWLERLQQGELDGMQLSQVYSIQKLIALCEGDWPAAEDHRKRAESAQLRHGSRVLSLLYAELMVHGAAQDLTGVKRVRDALHAMAKKYAHWMPVRYLADAFFARLRGDLGDALRAAELAIAEDEARFPHVGAQPPAIIMKVELLVALNRIEEAVAFAQPALAKYRALGMHQRVRFLEQALALADAKLGHFESARARVEAVIRESKELGIGRLQLGLSYEAGARVAILARDGALFEHYAALTAAFYQRARGSVLGALYERLQEDARAAGLVESWVSSRGADGDATSSETSSISQHIVSVMSNCVSPSDRARAALLLLGACSGSQGGVLFLLSDAGLKLTAATLDLTSAEAAREFAQNFLNAELSRYEAQRDQTVTVDARAAITPIQSDNQWQAPDGMRCTSVLISGWLEQQFCIVGVAVLKGSGLPIADLAETAAQLTKCLARVDVADSALICL